MYGRLHENDLDISRQITFDMTYHLDEMMTKITFDPSENMGMVLGFRLLDYE